MVGEPAELERLPRWRRRIDWLRRAAQAQHAGVLERESISSYSFAELEQLEGAGRKRRWDYESIRGVRQERRNACVQRYLAGIRKTAERDLGERELAPVVHLLVRGEGYVLPSFTPAATANSRETSIHAYIGDLAGAIAGREVWYRVRGVLRPDVYNRALRGATDTLRR